MKKIEKCTIWDKQVSDMGCVKCHILWGKGGRGGGKKRFGIIYEHPQKSIRERVFFSLSVFICSLWWICPSARRRVARRCCRCSWRWRPSGTGARRASGGCRKRRPGYVALPPARKTTFSLIHNLGFSLLYL